jgi:hypothetical protein
MSFMSFVGMQLPMKIDYNISVKTVYIGVCKDHIMTCKDDPEAYEALAPVPFGRHKNKHKDLPSWVVDWTSYPWHDNHIIPTSVRPPKLSPETVLWLYIESSPDPHQGRRTVEPPQRMTGATRYNATTSSPSQA